MITLCLGWGITESDWKNSEWREKKAKDQRETNQALFFMFEIPHGAFFLSLLSPRIRP